MDPLKVKTILDSLVPWKSAATGNLQQHRCTYLSGAGFDILSPALVPVGQQLDGGCGCAEPEQLWSLLIQETVIIEQVLVQHCSEGDMEGEWGAFDLFTHFKLKDQPGDILYCSYEQRNPIKEQNKQRNAHSMEY